MSKKNNYELPLLLYDDECSFCMRFKGALEKLDAQNMLHYVSIHEKEVYEEFPFLDIKECYDTIHLLAEDHKVYKGPEVIGQLLANFPGVKKFAWLLESEIGKKTLDLFYTSLNELRKSKLNTCSNCKKND